MYSKLLKNAKPRTSTENEDENFPRICEDKKLLKSAKTRKKRITAMTCTVHTKIQPLFELNRQSRVGV